MHNEEIEEKYEGENKNIIKSDISHVHPRILYIRKLYLMLFIQLLIVSIITFCAWYFSDFKNFLNKYHWILTVSLVLSLILLFFSLFFRKFAAKMPLNWIIYILFTLLISFCFSYAVALGNSDVALMVFVTGAAVCFSLMIYALTTKTELTYQGASLYVLGSILLTFQLFLIFTDVTFTHVIFVCVGEVLFAFYLVFDTMTYVSGSLYKWEKEDSVSGAVVIYLDVFLLFLRLCELLRQLIIKERN